MNPDGRLATGMLAITTCLLPVYLSGFFVKADTASLRQKFSSLGIDAIFPGDSNYEKFSTPFNRRFSYKPAAIAFPNDTNTVANAVKLGVQEQLRLSARSGGHSYAAYGLGGADGALVIDLQRIRQISVDSSGEAVIGPGIRLGDLAIGLNRQGGRALPHGTCPYVASGGHIAGGGYGFSSRQWGLTLDRIISHEVVLGDGSIVTASKTVNPDLFWASRGAGASYGIITSIRFRTEAAPSEATNFIYQWNLNEEDFAQTLMKLQSFCMSDVPAQLGITVNLRKSWQAGKLSFDFAGAWYGKESEFAAVVQPFLSQMPAPTSNSVKTTDWITSLQGLLWDNQTLSTEGVDLTQEHDTFYAKSLTTPESAPMSNASFMAFTKVLANQGFQSNTNWFVQFELYGGKHSAVTAVDADETAFAQRSILFTIQFYARSSNSSPPYPAEGFTLLDDMVNSIVDNNPSEWNYGAYANYVDERLSPSQWKSQYYKNHYGRLSQVKQSYDPQNVFSYPQSITDNRTPLHDSNKKPLNNNPSRPNDSNELKHNMIGMLVHICFLIPYWF
ncbi:hypothetical protein Pst134EA_004868 [Puccinia striiformis f. sp. tritici]|uniref:hypothetical protein n=1 Tax=Puccinia striiformis f. sp. tritici TaxID=168172 RepID=UPI00200835FE|nr:hypothetical protein Pst134EA_004868 [Puccinia striiformis f. sp. tritici]KAH9470958.1 hypothetical protein Pst134EA_004868 [Puccinia striiformis f. sp. tritici]